MGFTVLHSICLRFYELEAVSSKYSILHTLFLEYPVCNFLNTVQSIGVCSFLVMKLATFPGLFMMRSRMVCDSFMASAAVVFSLFVRRLTAVDGLYTTDLVVLLIPNTVLTYVTDFM